MRCHLVLETTADKLLCPGSEFTVVLKLYNQDQPFEAVLEHCLGQQLKLASHPCTVEVTGDCCQVVRARVHAKHGCTRVQYNVCVTDAFPLPMGRTYAKLVAVDGKVVRIDSNWASLGATPIVPKPFTVSQPVPCACTPSLPSKQCRC